MGQGEFRAAYSKGNAAGAGTDANDSTLFGLEYIYNLSKRTALYTQYGRLKTSGAALATVGAGPANVAGGTSPGYGAGVRHMF